MRTHWIFHAYMHAIEATKVLPRVTAGSLRGLGFSPFTQWTGCASHVGMLLPPFGCSAILGHVRRGGRDFIYLGTRGKTMLFTSPLTSNTVIQRNNAILIVVKPPRDREQRILGGMPVFDAETLVAGDPKFTPFNPDKQMFVRDDANGKGSSSHDCFYAFDPRPASHGALAKKPIMCTCGRKFATLQTWRIHLSSTWNDGKGDHTNPRKLPARAAAKLQRIKANAKLIADYDDAIVNAIGQNDRPRTLEKGALVLAWGGVLDDKKNRVVPTPSTEVEKVQRRVTFVTKPSLIFYERTAFHYIRPKVSRIDAKKRWNKMSKHRKDQERVSYHSDKSVFTDASVAPASDLPEVNRPGLRVDYGPPVPGDDDYIPPEALPPEGTAPEVLYHEEKGEKKKNKKKQRKHTVYHDKPRRSARTSHVNVFYVDYAQMHGNQHTALIKVIDSNIVCYRTNEPGIEADEVYTTEVNSTDILDDKNWENISSDYADIKFDKSKQLVWSAGACDKRLDDHLINLFEVHHSNFTPNDEFWRQTNDEVGIDIMLRDSPFQDDKFRDQCAESEVIQEILTERVSELETHDEDAYFLQKMNERDVKPGRLETIKAVVAMAKLDYDPGDPFNITKSVMGMPKDYDYYVSGGVDPGMEGFENLPYSERKTIVNEIIGESKFEQGDYEDPAPGGIPCFLPVAFNTMLLEESPTWKDAVEAWQSVTGETVNGEFVGYNTHGDEHLQFSTPLCEVNQCEIELGPDVVTGLKHMESSETESWLSKLTSANRKRFIVNNSAGALKSPLAPYYIQAMMKEVAGLSRLGLAEICPLPRGKRAIPCRFVFDIKWDSSTNKLVKFKARLVCQGFRQREYNAASGLGSYDRNDISSPVLKTTSLYAILNLATFPGMRLITADVGQAFLAARLKTDGTEEVYIQLPPVCQVRDGNIVIRPEILSYGRGKNKVNCVKLIKSLYGLKNSSQAWFRTIRHFLVEVAGLEQSKEDQCVFSNNSNTATASGSTLR